jgi:hypothetical protein
VVLQHTRRTVRRYAVHDAERAARCRVSLHCRPALCVHDRALAMWPPRPLRRNVWGAGWGGGWRRRLQAWERDPCHFGRERIDVNRCRRGQSRGSRWIGGRALQPVADRARRRRRRTRTVTRRTRTVTRRSTRRHRHRRFGGRHVRSRERNWPSRCRWLLLPVLILHGDDRLHAMIDSYGAVIKPLPPLYTQEHAAMSIMPWIGRSTRSFTTSQ